MGRLLVLCPRCHTDQVMQGSRTTVHIRNTTTDGFVAQLARRKEQAMPIPESVRALMTTGPQAHLTTLNPDGSPQVTMVWVGLEDDEFVMGHLGVWHKVKNIRRDPRVALTLLGQGKNPMGLQEYVVIYGRARITEGGAVPLLQRLAHLYLGPTVEFPPAPSRNNPGYITRITPTRFAGVGPWNPSQQE